MIQIYQNENQQYCISTPASFNSVAEPEPSGAELFCLETEPTSTKKLTYQGVYQAAQKAANAGHGDEFHTVAALGPEN